MMIKYLLILFVSFQLPSFFAQEIVILQYCNKPIHARGIAIKGKYIYLGNNNGEVIRYNIRNGKSNSLNSKDTFPEIRDLALYRNTVYAMQSADNSNILKLRRHRPIELIHLIYGALNPQLFLDGMAIENKEVFVMGDPVDNKFSLFHSSDLKHWEKITPPLSSFDGEAGFAASGSTVQIINGIYYFFSGGEKSLTAVAMLVAIFKSRPSPFYVLDEVEAALDDVNLGRLLGVLEELRESSQLIIITHQKRTMEIADALYGVTMRGDGVTEVISQRLRESDAS